jgi:natural product biosynthesis luciferase-like monooxygenase protein/amino acid adenylation domain-containing protein
MSKAELLRERTTVSSDSFDTELGRLNTVIELLRHRALNQPDQLAYTFLADRETEGERQTYADLDRKARAIGALLQMSEAGGQRALLLYPSGLDYIAAFFGCLYAGVIAVPAYPPHPSRITRNLPRIRAIVNDCKPSLALTNSSLLDVLKSADLQEMRWIATDQLEDDLAEQWLAPTLSENAVAFLQYTSGSTATPKGVMVTHRNLLHNEQLIKLAFQQTERSVIVGWLPLYHDMGLIGNVLQPLYLGASCILMSPTAFLLNPFRWLQAISDYRATTSGGPNFAYDLCVRKISPEQRASLDLSSWTTAFNGAEPIRVETLERFAAAFEPCGFRREAFSPCYGLAEATLLVCSDIKTGPVTTYTVEASALEQNKVVAASTKNESTRTLVSCGRALLDQKIVIADPASSTLCPPDEVGEIWLSGPSVTRGYWGRPEETAQTFGAYLADTGEAPFLRTGDLGFLNNGQLFITGRSKDLIVIRGRNHYPQDIELTVERSHPALRAGSGAAFSIEAEGEERLVVVQEVEFRQQQLDFTDVVETIRQNIAEEHEVQAFAIVLVKPGTVTKTSSGKIQRFACRSKFLEGSLDVLAEWRASAAPESEELPVDISTPPLQDAAAIEVWLAALLASKLKLDASEIDINQPIARYGVDSLMAIELTHSVEARLGIVLPGISFLQSPSIAQLAAKAASAVVAAPSGDKAILTPAGERPSESPLSYNQRALWFLHQLAPESAAYNIASLVRIDSDLNVSALRRSFQSLVDRHESLRTTFGVTAEGEPIQRIHEHLELCFEEENVAAWSAADLNSYLEEDVRHPFDLEHGPLLRIKLLKRSDHEYVLLLVLHHLITDLWSLSVLVNELGILYLAESAGTQVTLPPLALQYSDYSRWQTELLAGPGSERLWSYWEKQLTGELPVLNLPTDRPRPPLQTYQGASHPFELSAELTQRLNELSRAHGATLYMTLLAAFQTLLHRYTSQEVILVGSPTAGRSVAELGGLVGYFVNPVVLRADFSGDPTFGEFLAQVRQTALSAFEHQDYPFALLVEKLQPQRDPSRSPLFQTMFVFQKTSVLRDEGLALFALGEAGARLELGGLSIESLSLPQRTAQFDLTLNVTETQKGLAATLEYNKDLFEAATIERMAGHLQVLLEAITTNPAAHLSSLPLLTPAERQQTIRQWNDTSAAYASNKCLHQLFEEQVERTPDATALIFEDEQLSYRELNRRANQLAHHLRRAGVRAESLVGICVERSSHMMVGLLGILKAGGAYLPLDPTYPTERLQLMLEDASVAVLLTQHQFVSRLNAPNGARLFCLDTDWEQLAHESEENPLSESRSDNLAYVIYTSGSTGRPKGVMISHRNVVNFFTAMDQCLGPAEPGSVWLAVTSISFDISVLELFWTLARGFQVVLYKEQEQSPAGVQLGGNGSGLSAQRTMEFSLFYFASDGTAAQDRYQLLIEGAKFADRHGFKAVWTPERHFHAFGDLYPNPSVTSAAIATITEQIRIRAGSVVLPLHNPIRVAEEWAMVDNLSKGRVDLSFASGWHADDFVFAPENYPDRKALMVREIETIRKLWRGETLSFRGGAGNDVQVKLLPKPLQPELPVWVTAAGDPETFRVAGAVGGGLLTHLLGQNVDELAEKIGIYRQALLDNGHDPSTGHVTLMLHTFVGDDLDKVREQVREPFSNYLKTSIGLIKNFARSLGKEMDSTSFTPEDMEAVVAVAFERYFQTSGLMGTPETCLEMVERLKAIGVDEIACLIDFGADYAAVMESLLHLEEVKRRSDQARTRSVALANYSLEAQLRKHQVTHLQCTPSMASILSASTETLGALGTLHKLMLGGEALPASLAARLSETVTAGIHNMYGPTETTIWSATHLLDGEDGSAVVPIGRPIANTQMYVLDRSLEPLPVGIAGEVYIGGEGVARGYLNQASLTADKFVPDPFSCVAGARLYKTGDLARYQPDGKLEFLGRVDQQVKIRGFRIELEEIESILGTHESIHEAVVIAHEDKRGDKRLVAYVVADPQQSFARGKVQSYLREKLPEYMVPSIFILMDELPRTLNGKINRRALPPPDQASVERESRFVSPRTLVEEVLAGIWIELLGVDRVGIHDNFFELGGHSLLAVQMASRAREALKVELPVRLVFECPTLCDLAERLEQTMRADNELLLSSVKAGSRAGNLPLSYGQQRLWFLDQLEPGNPVYNVPTSVRLTGPLQVLALQQSLNEIIRRHEVLRTRFVTIDGEPVQVIKAELELPLEVIDLSVLTEDERETETLRLAQETATGGFDLATGPLLRARLLRLAAEEHILLLTMHHIISDGWSLGVLVREVGALYGAFSEGLGSPLPELTIQYADYAQWQREQLTSELLAEQLGYWREQLRGAPAVLGLPTDHVRPAVKSYRGARESFALSAELTAALKAMSREQGVTLFMVLLAAFKVLLWRYSGQTDVVVGTPIANRQQREIEELIGFFVNTLVLRTDLSGNPGFHELLGRVREVCLDAYTHQDVPFEKLVEMLQPERNLDHNPLFEVMFVFQNAPPILPKFSKLVLSQMEVGSLSTDFDLTLSVEDRHQDLCVLLDYNADLFEATTIKQLLKHLQNLLQSIVAAPQQKLLDLALLDQAEQHQLLREWNDTAREYPQHCLHELFEAQVERTPDAVAVIFEEQQLSYEELNRRANQLAHHLRSLGVGPEVLVGVLMERSLEMLVALLGILKSGGAYVPLDPSYPSERLAFMLADARAAVLLTEQTLVERVPDSETHVLVLGAHHEEISKNSQTNPRAMAAPGNLAYVIYTSGSTGLPKGVAIEHQSAATLVHWSHEEFSRDELSTVLASTSICFDLSVFELFVPLSCGKTVLLAEQALSLPELKHGSAVTLVNTVPSAMSELLRTDGLPASVASVNLAGERLSGKLVSELYDQPQVKVVRNLYGPSEDTTYSTCGVMEPEGEPDIGRPVANTEVYILGREMELVPVGAIGEIYIGGEGLSRGYLKRPELTAERFVPHPYAESSGKRLYRTGDLARYRKDGRIEYVGRSDHQVKIRGYRIELGEIEAVLTQHPAVRDSVVVASGDGADRRLVAYLTSGEKQKPTVSDLRKFLSEKLPDYMVPSVFALLDEMPMTPNGKVDRHALPEPEQLRIQAEDSYEAPRNTVEEALAEIWAEVLGIERVGIHDNFFNLGGHSLLVTKLNSRVKERFQVKIALRSMFQSPTVATLAQLIEQSPAQPNNKNLPKVEPAHRSDRRSSLLAKLNNLSEQEAQKMLRERKTLQRREIHHG